MLTHKQRVERVRSFTEKNKVFSVIAVIVVTMLIGNFVIKTVSEYKNKKSGTDTSVTVEVNEMEEVPVDTNINEEEKQSLRFYWIDLWILLGGGGFCVIKILQEKRKAKEKI